MLSVFIRNYVSDSFCRMQCAILRSSLTHSIRRTQSVRELIKHRFAKDTYLRKSAQSYSQSQSFAIRSLCAGVRKSTFACFAMEKTVLVPVADGTEEMEAVIIIDVLRRAGSKVVSDLHPGFEFCCPGDCRISRGQIGGGLFKRS